MGGRRKPPARATGPRCRGGYQVFACPIDRRLRLCARVGTQHLFVVVRRRSCVVSGAWSSAALLPAAVLCERAWCTVHEHTRRPTPVFMNTFFFNSNFHRPTWACGGRPPAPKQHTPTPVDGAFDGRPLQHREIRFWASNPKFPFVHEQTTPAASRTGCCGAFTTKLISPWPPICARWRVNRRRLNRSRHMAQRRQHLRRLWLIQSRDGSETKRSLTIEATAK